MHGYSAKHQSTKNSLSDHYIRNGTAWCWQKGAAALYLCHEPRPAAVRVAGYGAARDRGVSLTRRSRRGRRLGTGHQPCAARCPAAPFRHRLGYRAWRIDAARAMPLKLCCLEKVFASCMPPLRFHKWCIGHTLGSSTLLSVALAVHQMQVGASFALPYLSAAAHPALRAKPPAVLHHVLVCGLGFGGNCAALVLAK